MKPVIGVGDDRARWAALVDENLPPQALWPALTHEFSGDRYPDTLNLAEELLAAAERSPRAVAIVTRTEQVSYRTLRDRTLSAAGALVRLGVQPADRVAFRFHNTVEFVVVWLAVQWVGAIGVPIPPIYRRREIEHIVNHAGATLVVTSVDLAADVQSAAPRFANPRTRIVSVLHDALPPPPYPTAADAPVLITYISSSNGALRGVVHSPAELLSTADTYSRDVLQLSPRDMCIGLPSMAWSFGLGALLVFPLRAGASTVLLDQAGPPLPNAIAAHRPTVLFGVPTMYRLLLRQPDLETFDFGSLRCSVSAAEPLPAAVLDEWQARTRVDLLDGLGTTELAHIFISTRSGAVRPGSIGRLVSGYEGRVVDSDFRDVPDGMTGLLAVRGPTGARYWRDSEAQRLAVREGWTLTGDLCARDADGWFTHVRREDDLIVSGGYKISPVEVEITLGEHPDVCHARVFGVADATRGALPHAEVSLKPQVDPCGAVERLQHYLRQELAPYKCPRVIRIDGRS